MLTFCMLIVVEFESCDCILDCEACLSEAEATVWLHLVHVHEKSVAINLGHILKKCSYIFGIASPMDWVGGVGFQRGGFA